ncbi:MAG: TrpR-like protein YerC/YecD [Clostridia bacterium]|nr:TrpR-like protein YerC/YecD [Clostridia bacterium]
MAKRIETPVLKDLSKALLALGNEDDCLDFLNDLLTIKEMNAISQRWQVATMLKSGATYSDVCDTTGASSATISRVSRCIENGEGGYKRLLDRLYPEVNE